MEDVVVNGALVDVSTVAQLVVSNVGRNNDVVQDNRNEHVPHEQSANAAGNSSISGHRRFLCCSDQVGQGDLPPTEKTNICLYMYTLKLNRQPMFATNRGTYNGNC